MSISPTDHLFTRWGQMNHRVEELFILLHRMKHVPALNCLVPVVNEDFHKLLNKHRKSSSFKDKNTAVVQGIYSFIEILRTFL